MTPNHTPFKSRHRISCGVFLLLLNCHAGPVFAPGRPPEAPVKQTRVTAQSATESVQRAARTAAAAVKNLGGRVDGSRLLPGLGGALIRGVVVRVSRVDYVWAPVLIRFEELLSFGGGRSGANRLGAHHPREDEKADRQVIAGTISPRKSNSTAINCF
jgi:hypothetical protein